MSPEKNQGTKETLTPQEEAFEFLKKLVEKGPFEVSPGFVLRRRIEEDGNNGERKEFIVATNTVREDATLEESTHVFDEKGLHSDDHMSVRPSLIPGFPSRRLTGERVRSDYTLDEQKRYANLIVPFAANVKSRLDGQLGAVQPDGGNHPPDTRVVQRLPIALGPPGNVV